MVADLSDRLELERFLRDASAGELLAACGDIESGSAGALSDRAMSELAARIRYELRFRLPQPV